MTKKSKYQKTVFFFNSLVLSCSAGRVNGGFNSVFEHIFRNIYNKTKTGFYFAFLSLTLQTFTILYFSYL